MLPSFGAFHRVRYGPPRDELIATGLLGLSEAISAYDLKRNTAFRGSAKEVIRNELRE
jgi:DNA-directed RNA polymerase specialized sigma subunit